MSLVASIGEYIDASVHHSVRADALMAARHRAFIASRLLSGLVTLAILPVYLAVQGVPSSLEIAAFGWLAMPVAIAFYLSRTGHYEIAHVLSSATLIGLVTMVALATGGIHSFAAVWLIVVPIEAALSASRRVVILSAALALAAAMLLLVPETITGVSKDGVVGRESQVMATLGILSAGLYATILALSAESLARTSSRLLSNEEERYGLLARNMTDVITRHGRNGAVLFISPAAERLFAIHLDQLAGHGLFEHVHVADRPAYLKALADAGALGEAQSAEFRVRRGDSAGASVQFVWVEMRCRLLKDSNETVSDPGSRQVVAVLRDISDRKAQEKALEQAHADAEEANIAKGQFLATMSHELRTPLNAIIGFSDMLSQEELMKLDADRRRDYARLINESGQHLLSVVNGILDMSKIESGKFEITPEPFAPAVVIGHCCDLLALKAHEAGIDLVVQAANSLPEVNADKRALKQILLNLLSNAVKFTERGGRIVVRVEARDPDLFLSVEDNGVGISEADLPHLGNPFFQARTSYDRRYEGTGLGLSVVKGLVSLHGGTFDISSRLGTGTCVKIRIPLDCERAAKRDVLSTIASLPVFDDAKPHQLRSNTLDDRMKKSA